jgi:phosphonate transport system permease protein
VLGLDRIASFFHFLGQFFPPELSWSYVSLLGQPILETLGMASAGIVLAVLLAFPLSVIIGARIPGSGVLYAGLAAIRSIPDLTMAIFCVIIVGIGSGAGLAAIAIYYAAAMAKVFGEIFRSADPRPLDALRATGASRISIAAFGLIPLKLNDVLSYGVYELESAVRASVIVGAVAAGGLGTELVGELNAFEYRRVTTLVIALVILMMLVDRLCRWIRRYPPAVLALAPVGIVSMFFFWPRLFAARHAAETLARMWPPHLSSAQVHEVPELNLQTLAMAAGGTLLACTLGVLASPAAAKGIAPNGVVFAARRVLEIARAIPEIVWGLLFLTFAGIGPWAGVLALGLHSWGVLGKLFAESLENVPPDPIRALQATGASRFAVAAFGNVPLAAGPIVVHGLFRFEWNIRAATVLGIIGAGGIGQALYNAQQMFFYPQMLAYLLITCALVGIFDVAGTQLRKRFHVSWEAIE